MFFADLITAGIVFNLKAAWHISAVAEEAFY
jgi:hypothetical protein